MPCLIISNLLGAREYLYQAGACFGVSLILKGVFETEYEHILDILSLDFRRQPLKQICDAADPFLRNAFGHRLSHP